MTTALVLLLGVAVTGAVMPAVLAALGDTSLSPTALLWLWWSVITGTVLSSVTAVVVLLLPDHGDLTPAAWLLTSCWAALRSGPLHRDGAAALLVAVVLGLAAVRSTVQICRSLASVRRRSRTLLEMYGPVGRWERGVLWVDHPDALAFSVGGRARAVVASTGLRQRLTAAEVRAVLAHERSHLAGRHHLQVLLAEALARAIPVLPLLRRAPRAIRHLVELSADDRAARSSGRAVLHRALLGLATGPAGRVPPGASGTLGALGAAGSSVEMRLRRLARTSRTPSPGRQFGECAIAVVAGTALPVLTGSAGAALLLLVSCM